MRLLGWIVVFILTLIGFWACDSQHEPTQPPAPAPEAVAPRVAVPQLDPAALKRAKAIPDRKFCVRLGRALRQTKDREFARAMVWRLQDDFGETLNADEESAVRKGEIQLGMGECTAIATLGRLPEGINSTTNAYGVHAQFVFGDGRYLYFDNRKLTSWQD